MRQSTQILKQNQVGPRLALVVIACMFLSANQTVLGEQGVERLGIFASDEVEESGLADLLNAKLSNVKNLELVERQQLKLAAKEFEISRVLGSEGVGERLKLGQMVNADALVFLSLEDAGKLKLLRIVVSSCRYGARLCDEAFLYSTDKIDDHADRCAKIVQQTREQFADGITYLIGVTDLLSKNLTHDYDHLQAGFASLVANSLGSVAGVAVIEVAESRAISAELSRQGKRVERPIVPLVVEGEYEISSSGDSDALSVQLAVRLTDGKTVRKAFKRAGISMSDATELLTRDVPQTVLELSDDKATKLFRRDELLSKLAQRASAFSQRGAWKQATDLREAALLLEPKNHEQRLELIADYRHWHYGQHHVEKLFWNEYVRKFRFYHVYGKKRGMTIDKEKKQLAKIYVDRLTRIKRIANHLEFVCRFRAVNSYEAHLIMSFGYEDLPNLSFPGEGESREYQRIVRDLFWSTYPHFAHFGVEAGDMQARYCVVRGSPRVPIASARQSARIAVNTRGPLWVMGAIEYLLRTMPQRERIKIEDDYSHRVIREWDDVRTLDELLRFFLEVAPQNYPSDRMLELATGGHDLSMRDMMGLIVKGRIKADRFRNLFEKLKQSEKPLNQLYGRCGLLTLAIYADPEVKPDASALQEIDEITSSFSEVIRQAPGRVKTARYRTYLSVMRRDVQKRLAEKPAEKLHALPENMIPNVDATSRLSFIPVENITPDWEHVLRCTDSLDVMWSRTNLSVMTQKGDIRTIFTAGKNKQSITDAIEAVNWDGESIWFASRFSGVRVISPDGNLVAHVHTENGLPPYEPVQKRGLGQTPYNYPIMIQVIGKGRCLAIGRFGEQGRVWIALISRGEGRAAGEFEVRVIHKATKLSGDASDGVEEIFDLAWITTYDDLKNGRRYVLLGRRQRRGEEREGRRPLAIDVSTLKPMVLPVKFLSSGKRNEQYRGSGQNLFLASTEGLHVFTPNGELSGQWTSKTFVKSNHRKVRSTDPPITPQLLQYHGQFYNPGVNWYRIDCDTAKFERLTRFQVQHQHRFSHYGVTAHYGLVAWDIGDRLYRVEVDSETTLNDDLSILYPHVPAKNREAHHLATQEIRRLGGSVDAVLDRSYWDKKTRQTASWRTIVYLPKNWQGSDEGLDHLKQLHNLRRLYAVQAPITNQGVDAIANLSSLEVLYLVETKVTNEGLGELNRLTALNELRLEGSMNGQEFSDAGLRNLSSLERLQFLILYGKGFSDASLARVSTLPELRQLILYDAAIKTESLEKIRQQNRYFSYSLRPCRGSCAHRDCYRVLGKQKQGDAE